MIKSAIIFEKRKLPYDPFYLGQLDPMLMYSVSQTAHGTYMCNTCCKEYTWKKSLLRHLREAECGKNFKYSCQLCNKQYKRRDVLNQHMASAHSRVDGNVCYHESLIATEDNRKYVCVCGRKYKWKESFRLHQRVECGQPRRHVCLCGKKFKHKHHLTNHMSSQQQQQQQQQPRVIHKCDACGKCYQLATSLKRHVRLECGLEPRQGCNYCGKRFTHRFKLTHHMYSCWRKREFDEAAKRRGG
ncbi:RB-associated KRAB zinc finger protein-like [Copidosoma floridanum]|uniref:RB-associated KRAB zinc finger protein-like n=1 Tax=Copidosoma floridanum TaxID=29053 RepID=UPI000C6FB211|nr:RB-associated KRAB zinc finger protein-like [Copidosoma floridanum]